MNKIINLGQNNKSRKIHLFIWRDPIENKKA